MSDERPPRLAGDERATVVTLLGYHRESLLRKVSDLSDEEATRRFVGSETTLLWLVNHLARGTRSWILHRFAGEEEPRRPDPATVSEAVAACREAFRVTDAVIDQHDLDELCRLTVAGDATPVNLRWIVVHLLEETARHAGHADIIRELLDGTTGR